MAIQEMEHITVDPLDEETKKTGWPTVSWAIAAYLLRDYYEFERVYLMQHYVDAIDDVLMFSMAYLIEEYGTSLNIRRKDGNPDGEILEIGVDENE